jgi:hypothetical protein
MSDQHIRAYTREKLNALTAAELVDASNRLSDRTRLEVALTNQLAQALEAIKQLSKDGKEEAELMGLGDATPRKSKISRMVSNMFN